MQLPREWQKVSLVDVIHSTTKLTLPRGLPLGYLTQLEQRLADTELALFEALATLRSLGHDETVLVKASVKPGNESSKQGKQARMEDWGRLPLRDGMTQDIRAWLQAKADYYVTHETAKGWTPTQHNPISISYPAAATAKTAGNNAQASPAASSVETIVSTGTPPDHPGNFSHDGNDVSRQPPPETVGRSDHTIPEVSTGYRSMMPHDTNDSDLQIMDVRDGGKAAVLATRQSNLYF